jgi:hypothetical protein
VNWGLDAGRFRRKAAAAVSVLSALALLAVAPVAGADTFTFDSGVFHPTIGASASDVSGLIVVGVHNSTAATQTVSVTFDANGTNAPVQLQSVAPGASGAAAFHCASGVTPACASLGGVGNVVVLIQAQTAQLAPSINYEIGTLTGSEPTPRGEIEPGDFTISGPRGALDESVAALAGADVAAFGTLQSATGTLTSTLGSVSGQLGSTSSSVFAQLQSLQSQVATLTSAVNRLTAALKPAKRKKKPRKKR